MTSKLQQDWEVISSTDTRFSDKILHSSLDESGEAHNEWSYILHLAWAARKLSEIKPTKHIDISSYIYFPTIVSAFIDVEYYEYRNFNVELSNLSCGRADLVDLPFYDNSIKSLSCCHTIEHIGLGRYGDLLDADGDLKAANELVRVLAEGGNLLIVVPVGKPILRFNSSRTYSYQQVLDMFSSLTLKEFSLVEGDKLIVNAPIDLVDIQPGDATGCFWFTK